MAFPQSILPIAVELQINGVWTDVSADARGTDGTSAITIQRGITSSGGTVADRGTCSLTLDNNSGKYSSRNPRSPYFGYLGRNTPLRVSVAYGTPWLDVPYGSTVSATTNNAVVLDVTDGIEIRVDMEAAVWGEGQNVSQPGTVVLAAKYGAPGQRSWLFTLTDQGYLQFWWSTDGTNMLSATSTAPIVLPPNTRQTLRVLFDGGASLGNWQALFSTSSTAGTSGPWTTLGSVIAGVGVSSIFNSTAGVEIGNTAQGGYGTWARKIYAAAILNLSGTALANPNFGAQAVGTTSFVDTSIAPRTWTVPTGAITNAYRRFTGEVSSWPPQWDTGGKDVTTPITAAGILQRLGQRKSPLQSTLRHRLPGIVGLRAYWPMEEGGSATQAASPIAGVGPARTSGFTWGADGSLAGSAPLPQLSPPSSLVAQVPHLVTGDWQAEFVYKLDSLPAAPTVLMTVNVGSGTASQIQLLVGVASVQIQALDANGTVLASASATPDHFTDGWGRIQIKTATVGGVVYVYGLWLIVGTSTSLQVVTNYSGTPGGVSSVTGSWGSGFASLRIGHLAVYPYTSPNLYDNADRGFDGETSAARLARVATEQSIPMSVAAHAADTELVGAQTQDTVLNVVQGAAQADEGLLHEAREFLGMRYRGRRSLEGQASALDLPYVASPQALLAPLTPVEDDQGTVNDSTVTRTGGSFGRVTMPTGSLSTQDPPAGVGLYDESITLNLHSDDQPYYHAGWRTHLGTWDEARFPQVNIALEKNPALIPSACRIDTGSRIRITAPLPSWLPPDPIDNLVLGYSETIAQFSWRMSFACGPYGPWRTGVLDDAVVGRLDTDGSTLAVAATAADTTLWVETTGGPATAYWTTSAGDYPLALRLGGEVVTASSCASGITDSFTRTVSGGWGTATSGQTWATSGGASSDYSVNGASGLHSLTSVNVSRNTAAGPVVTDFDVEASFSTSVLAAGGSHFVTLIGRYADANNLMMARVEFTTAQAVNITIRKRVAGVETQLSTAATTLTHAAGALFRARFTGFGAAFQARVWLASSAEPTVWHTTVTDSSITAAGQIGVRSVLASANTNTLPVTVTVDDFALLNPQTFAVTRGTNGISKAQTVGTAVALDQPLYLAL
jgi:hypothetical protein